MQLAEVCMKRLNFIFALVILLAGGAIGAMSAPSYAQGYAGYNYPPPPQNSYANPWVGNNTPWTFYQGDWFLNGILHQFFGNQHGWAPYYAYPPTYIVRPHNWYAPQWNAWYQRNPHYWQNFEQRYPYWRGHRVGQRYDQNFYNKYHRGQGKGWHQGFQGVRPPVAAPGHGVRPPAAASGHVLHDSRATGGPGAQAPGVPGRSVRDPRSPGPVGPQPGATTPGVRGPGSPGPGVRPPGSTTPGVRGPGAPGPAVRDHRASGGPGVQKAGAPAPGERKPQKTTRGEEKPQ